MMPEGLVKISQGLYESILPLVKSQVGSNALLTLPYASSVNSELNANPARTSILLKL